MGLQKTRGDGRFHPAVREPFLARWAVDCLVSRVRTEKQRAEIGFRDTRRGWVLRWPASRPTFEARAGLSSKKANRYDSPARRPNRRASSNSRATPRHPALFAAAPGEDNRAAHARAHRSAGGSAALQTG